MKSITRAARARSLSLALLLGAVACADRSPTSPSPPDVTEPEADRASTTVLPSGGDGQNEHLQFLPPLVDGEPEETFENDPGFLADLTVEICEWDGSECVGAPVARFTAGDPPQSERLRVEEDEEPGHFIANWKTEAPAVSPATPYRIHVSAGTIALGHRDVIVAEAGETDATLDIASVRLGSTLPVKFRVRQDRIEGSAEDPVGTQLTPRTFTPEQEDYSTDHPVLDGVRISFNTMLLVFRSQTTLTEANAVLDRMNAFVVGATPSPTATIPGILVLRIPTETHDGMTRELERLQNLPEVRSAVQDIGLTPQIVTKTEGAVNPENDIDRQWTWEFVPRGGNWGLELANVPQMWNLNDGIEKARSQTGGTTSSEVLVYDGGFSDVHEDVVYTNLTPGAVFSVPEKTPEELQSHGTHVAGTIGATYGNDLGVDGINPWASLVVASGENGTVAELLGDYKRALDTRPDLRVVNVSLGWNLGDAYETQAAETLADQAGAVLSVLHFIIQSLRGGDLPVVVAAAGNDGATHARHASPWTNAALVQGNENIIVVEAHGLGLSPATFSNRGGHLSAPGIEILSTVLPGEGRGGVSDYDVKSGTSMAAPHVAGLVSYLYTLDPSLPAVTLTDNPIRDLLLANVTGNRSRMRAFRAAMDVDRLQGDDRVLRALLDVDDGTVDGNRRVDPETGDPFVSEDADGDGGTGDGSVDMSDFRRWRDWMLDASRDVIEGLDGPLDHPKRDANRDGKIKLSYGQEKLLSRGDFNGDGVLDLSETSPVPGALAGDQMTDLQVLAARFSDPVYSVTELQSLIFSADARIDAAACYENAPGATVTSTIRVITGATPEGLPTFYSRQLTHSPDAPIRVLTAPVAEASDPTRVIVSIHAEDPDGSVVASASKGADLLPGGDVYWTPTCEESDVNASPTATITSPDDGATFTDGETIVFEGSGSDPEDGTLTDASLVWTSDLDGQVGTGTSVSASLSVGTHTVTLTATDTEDATGEDAITVTVDAVNAPPTATITSPADGTTFVEGESIAFEGSGSDPEDGALTGSSLVWTSDLDGQLGTGSSFTSTLSVGTHTITLTATDSDGATDGDIVSITVESAPSPSGSGGILFNVLVTNDQIYRIPGDGSGPVALTGDDPDDPADGFYARGWSPDGRQILYSDISVFESGGGDLYRMNADGSGKTRLTDSPDLREGDASWSPAGDRIAFWRTPTRFDLPEIYVMNPDGTGAQSLTNNDLQETQPVWSPDGTGIAFVRRSYNGERYVHHIVTINADGTGQVELTSGASSNTDPVWSPSGDKIAFYSDRDGVYQSCALHVMNADGSGLVRLLDPTPAQCGSLAEDATWSPDGSRLAVLRTPDGDPITPAEIWVVEADGSGATNVTNDGSARDYHPVWSPDGTEIVYGSNPDDRTLAKLYVMNADGSNVRVIADPGETERAVDWK